MKATQWVPIPDAPDPPNLPCPHHGLSEQVVATVRDMYRQSGYQPPWTGYFAVRNGDILGTCAFKSPPVHNRVEIAYFTFPEHEGRGIATWMAARLIRIANEQHPGITCFAQTLPRECASTSILRKLGFLRTGVIVHPYDGTVWEWERQPEARDRQLESPDSKRLCPIL